MPDGYRHDVFISYTRADPVGPWVRGVLKLEVARWLKALMAREVDVFADEDIDDGAPVHPELLGHLRDSRCLLAVWSPNYPQRPWCTAEWGSMCARESEERAKGWEGKPLVFPVVYCGGSADRLVRVGGQEVRAELDFWDHSALRPTLVDTVDYLRFVKLVQVLCERLLPRVEHPPPWRADFPTLTPHPDPRAPIPYPRLAP